MKNKQIDNSRRSFLFLAMITIVLVSCSNSVRHNKAGTVNDEDKNTMLRKPPATFTDTIIIDFPAAVFYNPDSLQLEKIKAITDIMIFESMVHDCYYQMRNCRIVLKQNYPHIKIVEVKNARYLLFEKSGGEKEYIDLDTQNDPCGIFLFDGNKKARLADMMNIETELGFYFSE